ncbi:sensor histidine kinase [Clostridium sp. DL1XJH146]
MIKFKTTLTSKITFSFIILVFISVFISVTIANYIMGSQFNKYLDYEQEDKVERVQQLVQGIFESSDIEEYYSELKTYAEGQDLYIEIKDAGGESIFSTNKPSLMYRQQTKILESKGEIDKGHHIDSLTNSMNYEENNFSVIVDDEAVATLIIGYYDAFKYTEQVSLFKETMAKSFIFSGLIVIFLAIVLSYFISRSLSKPIISVTQIAHKIKEGNYKTKADESSSTKEIYDLSKSINFLGESLEKDKNLREKLTSNLVHEIKTPLTIINNFLDAFIDGIWTPDEEKLNSCKEEVDRLAKMTDKLKDIYLLESAQMHLNKEKFNLSKYVEGIIEVFSPLFREKNISIDKRLQLDIIANLDKDKVKQIIYNLLSNSMRYTDNGGIISIVLKNSNDKIILCVEDNGIGISKEDLPYIFERFYRSDESRSRETGGTGIGLSITKSLVEAQEGNIYVESEEGKGSKFVVEF